jgi:hypothetical protein
MRQGLLFLTAWFVAGSALAAPPSDSSVEELVDLVAPTQYMERLQGQMLTQVQMQADQLRKGRKLNPVQLAIIDQMVVDATSEAQSAFSVDKMKPIMLRIHRQVLTQEEVDASLKFYKTPAGASILKKMPQVMEMSVAEATLYFRPAVEKTQQITYKAKLDVEDARTPEGDREPRKGESP